MKLKKLKSAKGYQVGNYGRAGSAEYLIIDDKGKVIGSAKFYGYNWRAKDVDGNILAQADSFQDFKKKIQDLK